MLVGLNKFQSWHEHMFQYKGFAKYGSTTDVRIHHFSRDDCIIQGMINTKSALRVVN